MQRHHGENPNIVGAFDVENTIRKFTREMTADGRVDHAECLGHRTRISDQAMNFVIEAIAQLRTDSGVIL